SGHPHGVRARPRIVRAPITRATNRGRGWHTGPMHPTAEHVASELKTLGATGEVRELPEPAPTAVAAAAQLRCPVRAIPNSLLFNADGEPLLILTSGAHRVNTGKVAAELGVAKLGRADPDFVYASTGQRIGGVAPVGHPAPVRTVVDTALAPYDVVWAA